MTVRDAPGARLDGRFELRGSLGAGGTAIVYRAFDRRTGREVALKVARPPRTLEHSQTLQREYALLARLRHPGIVRAYDLRELHQGPFPAGTPYLVMEYVDGVPLHRASPAGPAPAAFVTRVARELLAILACVHRRGWVHRDLKPANVLLRRGTGRAFHLKLLDFGLAVSLGHRSPRGYVSGSFPYLAPECILGLPVDERTDLYGTGLLLFALATGRPALAARDPRAWIAWHLSGPPLDPAPLAPQLPARLAHLVRRLTHRSPAARPRSASHALRMLEPRGPNRAQSPPM